MLIWRIWLLKFTGKFDRKPTRKLSNQDSRSHGRVLNPGPPDYFVGLLTILPRRSVSARNSDVSPPHSLSRNEALFQILNNTSRTEAPFRILNNTYYCTYTCCVVVLVVGVIFFSLPVSPSQRQKLISRKSWTRSSKGAFIPYQLW